MSFFKDNHFCTFIFFSTTARLASSPSTDCTRRLPMRRRRSFLPSFAIRAPFRRRPRRPPREPPRPAPHASAAMRRTRTRTMTRSTRTWSGTFSPVRIIVARLRLVRYSSSFFSSSSRTCAHSTPTKEVCRSSSCCCYLMVKVCTPAFCSVLFCSVLLPPPPSPPLLLCVVFTPLVSAEQNLLCYQSESSTSSCKDKRFLMCFSLCV